MINDVEHIVAACQRREPSAQRRLYDEYGPMMLGVCMRYTRSRDEAQDLLHDGFIKVFENIGRLRTPQALEDWIYNIMVNESINYVKRRSKLTYCDVWEMAQQDELESQTEASPLDTDNYDTRWIVTLLQQLPEKYRLAFNMHEVDGLSYPEMALKLDQPETTVRSTYSRARQLLLNKIKKHAKNIAL